MTRARPRVSVLVPVYNRAELLQPCVESALAQTVTDLEVVIVDNCSTDGSWGVCQDFAARDSRVRAYRNESNLGPVRNWRQCARRAVGHFAKLLFSDDAMEPTFLEKTLPFLVDPQVGLAFTSARIGPTRNESMVYYSWKSRDTTATAAEFIRAHMHRDDSIPSSPGAALFRLGDLRDAVEREILAPDGFDFLGHGAGPDLLLYLLTATRYSRIGFVREPLSFFRLHPESITIDGRGGLVEEGYSRAIVWFGANHGFEREALELAVIWWKQRIRRQRRPMRFSEFLRGFAATPRPYSLMEVLGALARLERRRWQSILAVGRR